MPDTEEVNPVLVGDKVQWANLSTRAKILGGAVATFILAVWPTYQVMRVQKVESDAKIADIKAQAAKKQADEGAKESNAGWKAIAPRVDDHETRLHALELAAARAQPRGKAARRPIPVIVAPKARPLPPSLKAAVAQAEAKPQPPPPVAPATPTQAPTRAPDASP